MQRPRFFQDHPPLTPGFFSAFYSNLPSPMTNLACLHRNLLGIGPAMTERLLSGSRAGAETWRMNTSLPNCMNLSNIILPPIDLTRLNPIYEAQPVFYSHTASQIELCLASPKQSNGSRKDQHEAPCKKTKKIFPRRKAGKLCQGKRGPVILNEHIIRTYFHLPLADAADEIGISITALKSACRSHSLRQESSLLLMPKSESAVLDRKNGIRRWPYRFANQKLRSVESPQ